MVESIGLRRNMSRKFNITSRIKRRLINLRPQKYRGRGELIVQHTNPVAAFSHRVIRKL